MTIQRQYSLPNCTLVLDGFGDGTASVRPVMSMLTNAECRLMGQPVLRGGKDFFEALIATVSLYAQEMLSGVRVPVVDDAQSIVHLERIGGDAHQLLFTPPEGEQQTLKLNTVQLFDLVEAIDQFINDGQTLPQWTLGLKPASKKFVERESTSQQATPIAAGLGSLALAAAAFTFLPSPTIKQPSDLTFTPTATAKAAPAAPANPLVDPQPSTSPSPEASTSPTASPSAAASPTTAKITDPAKLKQLSTTLEQQLQVGLGSGAIAEAVRYEIQLGQDGKILDYRPLSEAAKNLVNQTPLDKLRYNAVPGTTTEEPVASLIAEFKPDGSVRVLGNETGAPTAPTPTADKPADKPAEAQKNSDSGSGEIRDRAKLVELQPKLYDAIDNAWKTNPSFSEKIAFGVRVNGEGAIVDFSPASDAAQDYKGETPLPSLGKEGDLDKTPEGRFAKFKVVFNPNGQLEVNPWDGYPEGQ
ncbi:MAG: hypothetical protein RLZZ511_410 [Cyanobacteriota bacterium]